jgi:Fanconi-associated nuclease 1
MTPSILVKMDKGKYPQYTISRTHDIWTSRYEYLQYEEALLTERWFEESLDVIRQTNKNNEDLINAIYAECWALCEEKIGLWELFVEAAQETQPAYYLRRFEAGSGKEVNIVLQQRV